MVDHDLDLAQRIPVLDGQAQLLLDLAGRGVGGLLASLAGAARELPASRTVGVAHEEYVVAVGDDTFDAAGVRSEDPPIDAQPRVGEAISEPLHWHWEGHQASVRGNRDRLTTIAPSRARPRGLSMP